MKKFVLLLCFLLTLNFAKASIDDDTFEIIYDFASKIMRGMTNTTTTDCSETFIKNKKDLSKVLKDLIEEIIEGGNILNILINSGKLGIIDPKIYEKCNVLGIVQLLNKFSTSSAYKDIGSSIIQNNEKIFEFIKGIIKGKDSEEKYNIFGKIVSTILNFYVK